MQREWRLATDAYRAALLPFLRPRGEAALRDPRQRAAPAPVTDFCFIIMSGFAAETLPGPVRLSLEIVFNAISRV
jgi:hypothetical protein